LCAPAGRFLCPLFVRSNHVETTRIHSIAFDTPRLTDTRLSQASWPCLSHTHTALYPHLKMMHKIAAAIGAAAEAARGIERDKTEGGRRQRTPTEEQLQAGTERLLHACGACVWLCVSSRRCCSRRHLCSQLYPRCMFCMCALDLGLEESRKK
jgi:hypothetical protein